MNTISFPKMFNSNSNKMNVNLSIYIKSINESLKSLLMTNPGELLGDPVYGCALREKLFDIKNDVNMLELRNIITKAISRYMPEILVNSSDIKIYSNPNNNKYKIIINYNVNKYIGEMFTFETII